VTAAALSVTANAQSRIYGAANPALTYIETGLVNGDTLTGALATTATTTSNVGPYAITQGTLAASPNYTLTYTAANLMIVDQLSPVGPPVTASTQSGAFPSSFVTENVSGNGDDLFTSAYFTADPRKSSCMPLGVSQSLNRYGSIDLTGGSSASCKMRKTK
jgi:MBG domain-containing protein